MLGQKLEDPVEDEIDHLIAITTKLEKLEYEADYAVPLYLITWSPDPKELPNSDFYLQHNVNVDFLSSYLKCCARGVFCVESTQIGNPHYHGWYQVSNDYIKESARIAIIKSMARFGNVKITQARTWKPFSWSERSNALYYYKKDLIMVTSGPSFYPNPIYDDTQSTVNWDVLGIVGFFDHRNKIDVTLKDKLSDRKFYRDFYQDTISTIK